MPRTSEREGKIEIAGDVVAYTQVRVTGRRHVHLVVGDDGRLQVRTPWFFPRAETEATIRAHSAWVRKTLAAARAHHLQRPPIRTGARLPYVDERLRLEILRARRATRATRVERAGDSLLVYAPTPDPEELRGVLRGWYRREARGYLSRRLANLSSSLGVRPSRLSIRGQRTRWGSCSTSGAISLNWRLMLVPSALSDYVIVHELCHLRHMDHSRRFWDMVASAVPDCHARRRELAAVPSWMEL